ncbi:hypothetical protein [Chitinophaga sp. 212800010-3]|uniref:hypothetical protein n=1 Tax=unclassified Chitinophaga TaxID=2619133 RepID=UPI002DF128F7|nr:FRG domain-containing protein [Chitinophaga sp. 212800010-3]
MEDRQLEFVKNQFIHIGAKEAFTADLVEKLKAYEPLIKHEYIKAYPDGDAHAVFHVKRSANMENYFLSEMDMSTIIAGTNIKHQNTFYFNHRNYERGDQPDNATFLQAYNFLQCRPVFFPNNKIWEQEVPSPSYKHGFFFEAFDQSYGYDLGKVLDQYSFFNPHDKLSILESLQAGNLEKQKFTTRDGSQRDYFITPAITSDSLDLFDENRKLVPIKEQIEQKLVSRKLGEKIQRQAGKNLKLNVEQRADIGKKKSIKQAIIEKIAPIKKLLRKI